MKLVIKMLITCISKNNIYISITCIRIKMLKDNHALKI